MSSLPTVVCVKKVKQDASEEWNENMPLPGDIIEGISEEGSEGIFVSAKAKSELCFQLWKIHQASEHAWLKVRRGENMVNLHVCVVPDHLNVRLQRMYTVRAASDERHVAVLADMTFEECSELQEMSRRIVNLDFQGFKRKGMKYDWKSKVGFYLPDHRSTVVSSVLFMPLKKETGTEAPTVRAMAWFSAAISSGIPLVFVNIQTEQIISSSNQGVTSKDLSRCTRRQDNASKSKTSLDIIRGIRLWFLPGVAEVSVQLVPQPGDIRFGLDMKRTEEGFVYIHSVSKETAAERAGVGQLCEQAKRKDHLLVISRLQGKSLMPCNVDSEGLIHCCDNADMKQTLVSAMEKGDSIQLHVMSWPDQTQTVPDPPVPGVATLRPPTN